MGALLEGEGWDVGAAVNLIGIRATIRLGSPIKLHVTGEPENGLRLRRSERRRRVYPAASAGAKQKQKQKKK